MINCNNNSPEYLRTNRICIFFLVISSASGDRWATFSGGGPQIRFLKIGRPLADLV
jgi:hypothetical protein